MRASRAPKTAISYLTVYPIVFRPVGFIDCGEARTFQIGPGKIYLDHPARIIEGVYLDPILMLPIAVTLRLIPVLQPDETISAAADSRYLRCLASLSSGIRAHLSRYIALVR